ncbi:hypothetical protein GI364_16485 [Alicyclobacillus sp. SO9]|nr:hypothetical protein GI364_16485 [Alicyclobacillus sp. SO9]
MTRGIVLELKCKWFRTYAPFKDLSHLLAGSTVMAVMDLVNGRCLFPLYVGGTDEVGQYMFTKT